LKFVKAIVDVHEFALVWLNGFNQL